VKKEGESRMKAVIEKKDGLYLIRLYDSDKGLVDIFVVEDIAYVNLEEKKEGK
jgi:hypothetical protein